MSDVKEIFELPLRNDPSTAAEIGAIGTKEQVYDVIRDITGKPSEAGAFHLRTGGIIKALSGIQKVADNVCLVPDGQCDSWPTMIWGSLGLALKRFPPQETPAKRFSCLLHLGLLEDLTTLASLPSPPVGWDAQNHPHLNAMLLQLVAELACGLLNVAMFLLNNPTHKQRSADNERYTHFQGEHRKTSLRMKCLATQLAVYKEEPSTIDVGFRKLFQRSSDNIPIHICKHFQGRDDYVANMHAAFLRTRESPAVLSVHGLPGIGKTQLAARYCREYSREYQAILWIDADSSLKIENGLARYALRSELLQTNVEGDNRTNAEALISWLQSTGERGLRVVSDSANKHFSLFIDVPWILIFDNVDDVTILSRYWPNGGKGRIILTQRNPYNADFRASASFYVQPLDLKSSMALFYSIVGQAKISQHTSDIERLFVEWGGVPLALNQIGNFVYRRGLTLQRFVSLYTRNAPRVYGVKNDVDDYPYSIVTAFAVQELDKHAKVLLHAMCFLDPNSVPSELLLSSIDEGEPFNTIECDFDYFDAVETLCKRALLVQVESKLSVHRLVQSVTFDSMTLEERNRAFEAVLSVLLRQFPQESHGKPMWHERQRCASYLPHVLFLCKRYSDMFAKRKSVKFADLVCACTWYMFEQGLFSEAESLLTLGIEAHAASSEDLTIAKLCFNLAAIRCECNRISEARDLCRRTLKIREAILAPNDPLLGNTFYSMGILYMEDGQLDKALSYNKRAVNIHENCTDHDHSPTAFSYGNLGLCYLKMGDLDLASSCMEKSELLWKRSCGDGSDRYATIMYYMGNLRLAQGRVAESKLLHIRAFNILRRVTPNHIKTGLSYHKLACFHAEDGDTGQAIKCLEHATTIFQKQFDPTPRVARSLYKMSEVFHAAGNMIEAEEKRLQAEDMRRKITTIPFNPGPPQIAFDTLVPSFLA